MYRAEDIETVVKNFDNNLHVPSSASLTSLEILFRKIERITELKPTSCLHLPEFYFSSSVSELLTTGHTIVNGLHELKKRIRSCTEPES